MKILFIYPDYKLEIDPLTKKLIRIENGGWYLEGLASLAAVLKANGHQVCLYHLTAPAEKGEFQARVRQNCPDLIGFTVMTRVFPAVREYACWVKEALAVPIICGSCHPTSMPEEVIAAEGIDILCRGEGEEALCELVKRLDAGEDYTGVLNLWVKVHNQVYRNPVRPLLEDIDQLPLPDFGLFDFSRLLATHIKTAVVILSRGCPYSCTYCCNSKLREIYPNKRHYARFHSPEYAIEYLQKLLQTCPEIEYLNFRDDILPWQNDWLLNFTRLYKRKINLPFICNYRANLFNPETARILKEAGCYQIFFGVESGSDYIRNEVLKRNMSREQIIKAFAACRQVGIKTVAYNMVGLPYENKARVLETIKLNAEIKADVSLNPIYYPYPGTPLFELAVREGFVPAVYDYREDRCLEQPAFPLKQLFFARYYFKTFVRIYRLLGCLPGFLAQPLEKLADRLFTSPYVPQSLLIKIAQTSEQGLQKAKNNFRLRFPRIYIRIRNHFRKVKTTKDLR